jgi:hypothetical protein
MVAVVDGPRAAFCWVDAATRACMQAVFGASAAWNVVERRRKPRKKADSAAPIGGRLGWAMELLGEHGLWVRYVGIRGTGPGQARPQRGTLSHHASCHQIRIPVSRYQPIPARNLNAVRQLICVSCPVPHPTPPAAAGLRSRICGGIQTRQIFWEDRWVQDFGFRKSR